MARRRDRHPGFKKSLASYVRADVYRVRREALIRLEENGGKWWLKVNPQGRLTVLVVIGQGCGLDGTPVAGRHFREALLCEVGLRRAKPYRDARGIRSDNRPWLPARRKWFGLSDEQYSEVGPWVLKLIQYWANLTAENWADKYAYRIPLSRSQKRNGAHDITSWPIERGVRVTVSDHNHQLANQLREGGEIRIITVREGIAPVKRLKQAARKRPSRGRHAQASRRAYSTFEVYPNWLKEFPEVTIPLPVHRGRRRWKRAKSKSWDLVEIIRSIFAD